MHPDPSPRVAQHPGVAAALALALVASGCASTQPQIRIAWPAPPETARVKYVRSFRSPEHLKKSFLRAVANALVPRDSRSSIAEPTALALSPDGEILYVVSAVKARVVRVDLSGGSMDVVAESHGERPAQPFGVAVDGDGNYYVSDRHENNVFVFSAGGAFLRKFGNGTLQVPGGMAIDRKRHLLYVVTGATLDNDHRVEVYSLKGEHLRTIGRRGDAPGEFNFPAAVAVGPDGNVYVTDMLNFRIQVFNPEGELQTFFGQIGAGEPGTFEKAKGISFDTFGNIYVVDSMHGIQIFNPKFQPLMEFGKGFVKLGNPIAISAKNDIYVGDYALAGVHQFLLVNTSAADSYGPGGAEAATAPVTAPPAPPVVDPAAEPVTTPIPPADAPAR